MRLLTALAAAVVLAGLVVAGSAIAGGKKKPTSVIFFAGNPKFQNSGKVQAKGSLNTVSACRPNRGVRLQQLDVNGSVLATLSGATTDSSGNYSLSGDLPKPRPTGSVRVKALKRTAGKFVCKPGVSFAVPIPQS